MEDGKIVSSSRHSQGNGVADVVRFPRTTPYISPARHRQIHLRRSSSSFLTTTSQTMIGQTTTGQTTTGRVNPDSPDNCVRPSPDARGQRSPSNHSTQPVVVPRNTSCCTPLRRNDDRRTRSSPTYPRYDTPETIASLSTRNGNFFSRAARRLSLSSSKRRRRSNAVQRPIYPTNFASLLRYSQPCLLPDMLQRFNGPPHVVGKVKVILKVSAQSSTDLSFLKVSSSRKVLTLSNPHVSPMQRLRSSSCASLPPRMFAFDRIFVPTDPLADICAESLSSILQATVDDGCDGCILSFGLAKAGKTYTMFGVDDSPQNLGIIPSAFVWLYRLVENKRLRTGTDLSVVISAFEVTSKDEILNDLLSPSNIFNLRRPRIACRHSNATDSNSLGENVREIEAPDVESAALLLDAAIASRTAPENDRDSQNSHFVFSLHVHERWRQRMSDGTNTRYEGRCSRLRLIDLGSCGRSKNGTAPSFSGLSTIIGSVLTGQRNLPYRESKLTRLICESLGGHVCVIAHILPGQHSYSDTLQVVQAAGWIQGLQPHKTLKASCASEVSSWDSQSTSLRQRRRRSGIRLGTFGSGTVYTRSASSDQEGTSINVGLCDSISDDVWNRRIPKSKRLSDGVVSTSQIPAGRQTVHKVLQYNVALSPNRHEGRTSLSNASPNSSHTSSKCNFPATSSRRRESRQTEEAFNRRLVLLEEEKWVDGPPEFQVKYPKHSENFPTSFEDRRNFMMHLSPTNSKSESSHLKSHVQNITFFPQENLHTHNKFPRNEKKSTHRFSPNSKSAFEFSRNEESMYEIKFEDELEVQNDRTNGLNLKTVRFDGGFVKKDEKIRSIVNKDRRVPVYDVLSGYDNRGLEQKTDVKNDLELKSTQKKLEQVRNLASPTATCDVSHSNRFLDNDTHGNLPLRNHPLIIHTLNKSDSDCTKSANSNTMLSKRSLSSMMLHFGSKTTRNVRTPPVNLGVVHIENCLHVSSPELKLLSPYHAIADPRTAVSGYSSGRGSDVSSSPNRVAPPPTPKRRISDIDNSSGYESVAKESNASPPLTTRGNPKIGKKAEKQKSLRSDSLVYNRSRSLPSKSFHNPESISFSVYPTNHPGIWMSQEYVTEVTTSTLTENSTSTPLVTTKMKKGRKQKIIELFTRRKSTNKSEERTEVSAVPPSSGPGQGQGRSIEQTESLKMNNVRLERGSNDRRSRVMF